jgi:hypothetical protein
MVQFKLLLRGLVHQVTFKNVDQPLWHELSQKIGEVCNIPHAAVALTYLDPDGDKITISSQVELKEYYSSLNRDDAESSALYKFIVRNLNDGIPDPDEANLREDNFLMRDDRSTGATGGGGSQWGFNANPQVQESPPAAKSSGWSLPIPGFGWGNNSANKNQNNTQPASHPEEEDEKAYRERILASIANVHGTSPPAQQQPQPRQRKVSIQNKGDNGEAYREGIQVSIANVSGTTRPRMNPW